MLGWRGWSLLMLTFIPDIQQTPEHVWPWSKMPQKSWQSSLMEVKVLSQGLAGAFHNIGNDKNNVVANAANGNR
jgi:hypothetical protein